MSVKYNVVARGNPSNPQAPKKYYPSLEATGRTSLRETLQRAERTSTLSTADMIAAIEILLITIPEELAAGNVVDLGEFGSFWLKINADGAGQPEKVNPGQITTLVPHFRPGKLFKKRLAQVKFQKA